MRTSSRAALPTPAAAAALLRAAFAGEVCAGRGDRPPSLALALSRTRKPAPTATPESRDAEAARLGGTRRSRDRAQQSAGDADATARLVPVPRSSEAARRRIRFRLAGDPQNKISAGRRDNGDPRAKWSGEDHVPPLHHWQDRVRQVRTLPTQTYCTTYTGSKLYHIHRILPYIGRNCTTYTGFQLNKSPSGASLARPSTAGAHVSHPKLTDLYHRHRMST